MPAADSKVSLRRFIMVGELLEQAFARPTAVPDHLAHECELAEQALLRAGTGSVSTDDPTLARLFALSYRRR